MGFEKILFYRRNIGIAYVGILNLREIPAESYWKRSQQGNMSKIFLRILLGKYF